MKILLIVIVIVLVLVLFAFFQTKKVLRGRRKALDAHPKDFGVDAVELDFITEDEVELKGWWVPHTNSSRTIILMHGWGMNKADIFKYTHFLLEEGYNLFYFDFRALGESEGEESGIGMLEDKDIDAAIKFIQNKYPEKTTHIALYGISMGATVAAYRAGTDRDIKCVVLEATYYSFKNVVSLWAWTHKRVPYFPVVPLVLFFMKKALGVNFEDLSPYSTAPKITCPVLMIHGEFDSLAPLKNAKEIFNLITAQKEMWVVLGAHHNNCAQIAGEEYKKKLTEFFKKNF